MTKKIVWFSEWKKKYKHPFPEFEPFVEQSFEQAKAENDADAYVQINIRHPYVVKESFREPFYKFIEQTGKPKIVFETAVFRQDDANQTKEKYLRFSWNSYLWNEGKFGKMGNPSDRWERIRKEQNIKIDPWKKYRGKYVLIFLQHAIDTSLFRMIEKYGSIYNWLHHAVRLVRKNTDLPIVIRPHPKHGAASNHFEANRIDEIFKEFKDVRWSENIGQNNLSGGDYLLRDLREAHAAVGWTSNALTEAACAGVPVYPMSGGAMCLPVACFDFTKIDNNVECVDRHQWLSDLAYCQWTREEILNGTAWNHIKDGMYE